MGSGRDTPWQQEMEASFPYEETPDQLQAVVEVKADMESGRPMDRLVVGDVGYGKTEVALRAAFKAIQDGKQVAVLVPTTVLAAQHHQTFSQQFAAFPLKVRLLSRFVPNREQAATIAGLADGSVDLVIGTHRLLSKDVTFRDLGLVVVDEEQRFGVAAKERLKQLRREVDVLTLPRPRSRGTLNLALAGVPRHVGDRERRPRIGYRSRPASPRRRPGSCATRSCASSTVAARCSSSTTGWRRSRPGRAAPADAARREVRRRSRADGRGPPRERDDRVRLGRRGRAGVHDDHRVRARHPEARTRS